MSCIGCNQAITQQKANDEQTIKVAMERAQRTKEDVGLYRNEEGQLCIAPTNIGYQIILIITQDMR